MYYDCNQAHKENKLLNQKNIKRHQRGFVVDTNINYLSS